MGSPDLAWEGPHGRELLDLRQRLVDAEYTTEGLRAALAIAAPVERILADTARHSFFYLEELGAKPTAAAVLGQLFLFGGDVAPDRWQLVPEALREVLERRGFVEGVGGGPDLRATVALGEHRGRYLLSDKLFDHRGGAIAMNPATACMPLHASSLELLATAPCTEGASFLDIGCGSGCQSLLAAPAGARIVGFDLDPRSVDFARVNAAMNGVEARYAVGDCLTYDDGTRYDHVAFNAPNAAVGFAFLDAPTLDAVLEPDGVARMWVWFEVKRVEQTATEAIRRRFRQADRFDLEVHRVAGSAFALSPDQLERGELPAHSVLVTDATAKPAYLARLKADGIREVACAVLELRRAP